MNSIQNDNMELNMNYYVNENIKNTYRIFPGQGRYDFARYDLNENPEGLPKEFVDCVLSEITPEFLAIYPEPNRFIEKYAKHIGVAFENVLPTNGSDMAIRYILETFGEKDKKVVTVAPTFEMYAVNCNILGLKHSPVSYKDDLTIDVNDIIKAIDNDTRIVALVNPNNPIGNVYSKSEIVSIVEKAKSIGAIVIVDEAYHYFCPETFVDEIKNYDNVLILRTFSKLFSIAACRIGIIISNPTIINYIKNGKLTFDVNSIALLFAERLLDHPEIMQQLINDEREGKQYTISELEKHGYNCKSCAGNYIFVKPKNDAKFIVEKLATEKKLLVHGFGNPLLKDQIRVSIGSKKAMEKFIEIFLDADK